jgi:hypothetical protein
VRDLFLRFFGVCVKDRLGDQRGGNEWEPIKILSYEMNSTYNPIVTRITHTHKSGSKLGTHKPTSPRDNPQIKMRKHKTRGKELGRSWLAEADYP